MSNSSIPPTTDVIATILPASLKEEISKIVANSTNFEDPDDDYINTHVKAIQDRVKAAAAERIDSIETSIAEAKMKLSFDKAELANIQAEQERAAKKEQERAAKKERAEKALTAAILAEEVARNASPEESREKIDLLFKAMEELKFANAEFAQELADWFFGSVFVRHRVPPPGEF